MIYFSSSFYHGFLSQLEVQLEIQVNQIQRIITEISSLFHSRLTRSYRSRTDLRAERGTVMRK